MIMKKSTTIIISVIIFLFCPNITFAQVVKIKVDGGSSFCGFSIVNGYYVKNNNKEYITKKAQAGDNSGLVEVVTAIISKLGFDVPINVYIAAGEDNCFATIGEGGERLIIADQLFLNVVNNKSGTQWAAISIIAHEIGHHIAGFSKTVSQSSASELDADYWSGYVLKKLGASKEASAKCIMFFGTESDTASHPNKHKRISAIQQGWDDASKGFYNKDRCKNCQ